jgi:hypothetical protein
MQLLDLIGENLFHELHGAYQPVFDEIMRLEKDFPEVAHNQLKVTGIDESAMYNSQAHMLYMMQGKIPEPERKTRRELRDALQVLQTIPGMRTVVISLVVEAFAATLYMVEDLFFLNRELERRIEHSELTEYTREQLVYPTERIDAIVAQAYAIWKVDYVLQDAGQE